MPGDYVFLFAEGAGTTSYAGYSALGQTATFAGSSPKWKGGAFGGPGLSFSTSHLDFGTGFANFQKTNAFSGLAWINVGGGTPSGSIFEKWNVQNSVVAGQGGWQFVLSGGNVYLTLTNSNGTNARQAHGGSNVADGLWHQVAFTYDGSNTAAGIQAYVDGRAETMTVDSDVDPGTLQDTNLWFGDRQGVSGMTMTGLIDHAIIHSGRWLARDIARLYAEPFAMFAQPLPRRFFFGPGGLAPGAIFRQRKRKVSRPAARRRRRASAFLVTGNFPPRLARGQRRRRSSAAAFRRKRRQAPTEGLLVHGVPPELMKRKQKGRQQVRRRRPRRNPAPAPRGGCPTLTVIEAMTATARTIEAFTATALTAECLGARATTYEAMIATVLATEAFTSTARVVPCVKG
jgi:hypothetical protein